MKVQGFWMRIEGFGLDFRGLDLNRGFGLDFWGLGYHNHTIRLAR